MSFRDSLNRVVARHEELQALVARHPEPGTADYTAKLKEMSDLEPVVDAIQRLRAAETELADTRALLDDPGADPELREMAQQEVASLRDRVGELEHEVKLKLLPKDADDERNAILEVRAGTGGEEAALFAADLLRMYQRYAAQRGWGFEVVTYHDAGQGGAKEATARVSGTGVFARLKYESGVHRVQRVPATESGGRIHTSAATVAVLPEVEAVDIDIANHELRIDTYRAQGAGGQHVNTTDSAVRITHLPTGVVVTCQENKSQHKNRAQALQVLRARLHDMERRRQQAEREESRRSQVGSGDRSERIRTYNFPQSRVTDHRIGYTTHNLDQVLNGPGLDELVDALIAEDQAAKLAELERA